jgi:hypothetical protein
MSIVFLRRFAFLLLASVLPLGFGALSVSAAPLHQSSQSLYTLQFTARVPFWNAASCYDIIVVVDHTAYVADNSIDKVHAAVERVQGNNVTPIGQGDFQGPADCQQFNFSQEGPTGTLVVGNQLWAGDGDSTVKVFDLPSGTLLKTIQIGTPADNRADELDYIPTTNEVVVANPDAQPHPFLTYIDATSLDQVGASQVFDGSNGLPDAQALEQPRFFRGIQYQAVPGTVNPDGSLDNNGEIDALDAKTHSILRRYPTINCGPSGLTMIGKYAATGCANGPSEIVNLQTGQVTTIGAGKGSDMVAGDTTLGRFFFADYGSATLIVTDVQGKILDQIGTDGLAHSVGVDQQTHRVYVPEGSLGGVAQYVPTDE